MTGNQTDSQTETEREADRQTGRQPATQTDRQPARQTDEEPDSQTARQRRTDRQTANRPTNQQEFTHPPTHPTPPHPPSPSPSHTIHPPPPLRFFKKEKEGARVGGVTALIARNHTLQDPTRHDPTDPTCPKTETFPKPSFCCENRVFL